MNKFGYSRVEEFHTIHSGRGFLIKERNTIEIKQKNKRLTKFDSSELLYSPLLFESYNLIKNSVGFEKLEGYKLLALIQLETGNFFKIKINETNFDIHNLSFYLNYGSLDNYINEQFITDLTYNGVKLKSQKEDVVCTGNRVVFL